MKTAHVFPDAKELRWLLDRALNTLEPQDWPQWVNALVAPDGGILPTDKLDLVIRREE